MTKLPYVSKVYLHREVKHPNYYANPNPISPYPA
jgi:hypothetical protein